MLLIVSPMRLSSRLKPFDSSDYLYEIKHDGFRAQATGAFLLEGMLPVCVPGTPPTQKEDSPMSCDVKDSLLKNYRDFTAGYVKAVKLMKKGAQAL
jgi:hypothetical protein